MKQYLVLTALLVTSTAHAQRTSRLGNDPVLFGDDTSYWAFEENIAPIFKVNNDTSTTPDFPGIGPTRTMGVDLRSSLTLVYEAQWIVGVGHSYDRSTAKRELVAYGQDAMVQSYKLETWGPVVGWTDGAWRVTFTYLPAFNQRVVTKTNNWSATTGDVIVKNSGRDGVQVNLGYTFRVMGRVYLGPSLSYRALRFNRQSRTNAYSTADTYAERPLYRAMKLETLTPMVNVSLRF